MSHGWPGNVRELRYVAERHISAWRRGPRSASEATHGDGIGDDMPSTLREAVAARERQLIANAIRSQRGNAWTRQP